MFMGSFEVDSLSGWWRDSSLFCLLVDGRIDRQICLVDMACCDPAPERRPPADPGHRLPAVLRARPAGRRRGHDHRRVRRRQGDLLQALPGQGRPGARLPRPGRRGLDRPAPAAAAAAGPDRATSSSGSSTRSAPTCRREGYRGCAFINAAAEAVPGAPVHDRTVAHKQSVLAWVQRARRPRPGPTTRRAGPLADPAARRRPGQRCAGRRPGGRAGCAQLSPSALVTRRSALSRQTVTGRRTRVTRAYQAAVSR